MSIWNELLNQLNIVSHQPVGAIRVNSQDVQSGDVFVAIRGGHQYIEQALSQGAQVIISERPGNSPFIHQVKDSIEWLGRLASLYRLQLSAVVVGITGSVGKTSLTQLLIHSLSKHGITHGTCGNENNELGVPLTLISTPINAEFVVVEMGVAKPGDMDTLAPMVSPDIAIITKIGPSHLAHLQSADGVWEEKSKLLSYAQHVILNQACGYARSHQEFAQWVMPLQWDSQSVSIAMMHAVGEYLNLELSEQGMQWPKSRMSQYVHVSGSLVIDDSYNANYLSYLHAIRLIQRFEKKALVVGEMGDLGAKSRYYHEMLAYFMCRYHFDDVVFYGKETETMIMVYDGVCCYMNEKDLVKQKIAGWIEQKMTVLIKGSRHLALDEVCP